MNTPVRAPTAPHPVNPARPRPLPGPPKPPTPQPQPGRALSEDHPPRNAPGGCFLAALSIAAGLALIGAGLAVSVGGEDRRLMPTDRIAVPVLLALFALFTVVSLASRPPRRDTCPLRIARAGAPAVGRDAAGAPTKLPPSRASEGWTAAAG